MDKKEKLKKETAELESTARKARIKNQDAQKENQGLHQHKTLIIKETTVLQGKQEEEKEKFNKLSKKAVQKEKDFNDSESERKATNDALVKKAKDLDSFQDALNSSDKGIKKRLASTSEGEKKLDDKNVTFEDDKIAFAKKVAGHDKEYAEFGKKKKVRGLEDASLEARRKKVTEDENSAIANLDKAKDIKGKWQLKLDVVTEGNVTLDNNTKDFAQKEAQYDKDKEQLTLDQDEATTEKEKNEKDKASIKRAYGELEKQKDEVRVTELRVKKLIRDKGIKEELAKLEKDLKK